MTHRARPTAASTPRHGERGVALLTAILVTALASMLAVAMVSRQHVEIRRTANVLESERAYLFALGAEGWVKHILQRDDPSKDSLDEDWAVNLPPISVEGAQLAGRVEDLQGRFNLNNVVRGGKAHQPAVELFQHLLESLQLSPDLALALVDWIDEDMEVSFPAGAEDDEYLSAPVPYRAANRPLTSPSELLLIKGFTPEVYAQLAPLVTALPVPTPININTAPPAVLAALGEGLTAAEVEGIVAQREEKPFADTNELLNDGAFRSRAAALRQRGVLSVNSSFFLLQGAARFGERGKVDLYSLFSRKGGKVAVLWRAQGVY